jgi:hypothetical protein
VECHVVYDKQAHVNSYFSLGKARKIGGDYPKVEEHEFF